MGMSFLWDGTGINCYGMGMGQINMSHGQPCGFPNEIFAVNAL